MNQFHLAVLVDEQAKKYGERTVLRYRDDERNVWIPISWNALADKVNRLACALLHHRVGIQENMAVFSQNKPEFIMTDFAAFAVRAVTIPLYATSSEAQVQYILNDAQVRLLFVGDQEQYDTAFRVHTLCSSLERIVIFNSRVQKNPQDITSVYLEDFMQEGQTEENRIRVAELKRQCSYDDIANILYTSGTTGEPKGVMLHHSCYDAQFKSHQEELPMLSDKEVVMDFLPLTHVFERGWVLLCLTIGSEICMNHNPKEILRSIMEIRPTSMCSVPRFWEKVYDGVQEKIASFSPTMRRIVDDAVKVGKQHNLEYLAKGKTPPMWLHLKYKIYERTVFYALRKAIGLERGTFFPTAGAAIPPAVEEFIHAVGINMIAGYGLTESTATVSCDRGCKTIGSIGRPLPHLQVKIGADNEILVKGASITHGYYKKEAATRAAFDEEGFFHTGDVGYFKDGELYMTERIKDLYKTSNGKYIAPQVLEGKLCVDKYIDQIAIIADQRKFVSALIIPAYGAVKQYAEKQGIVYTDMKDLLQKEEIHRLFSDRIETLQQEFAHYEQVKRFTLLPEPFSMERGELTNTLKIRRPVLLQNYAEEIRRMYED